MISKAVAVLFLFSALGAISHAQTIVSDLNRTSGWNSCSSCAGIGGQGPKVPHWFKQGIASPSLSGRSMQFFLGGRAPYANAYWWKPIVSGSGATNFVYDLYYYIQNASAPQALEFEVNQGLSSKKYIFGVQCEFGSRLWRVFDALHQRWMDTSIPCNATAGYTWRHIVFEFHRMASTKQSQFVSITVDGKKYYFNRTYLPKADSIRTINVAFQMDGNKNQTNYSTWLDKVNLKYW